MTNLFKQMPKALQDMYGRNEIFMQIVNQAEAADVEYLPMLEKTIQAVFEELEVLQEAVARGQAL